MAQSNPRVQEWFEGEVLLMFIPQTNQKYFARVNFIYDVLNLDVSNLEWKNSLLKFCEQSDCDSFCINPSGSVEHIFGIECNLNAILASLVDTCSRCVSSVSSVYIQASATVSLIDHICQLRQGTLKSVPQRKLYTSAMEHCLAFVRKRYVLP